MNGAARIVAVAAVAVVLAWTTAAVADGVMLVRAGPFWMGADDGAPDEAPLHRAYVGDVWIDRDKAKTVSFKAGPERFLELTDRSGIVPAPYLARAHWVQVQDAKALSDADARALVAHSHTLVAAKLPKKIRTALADASHVRSAVRAKR